MHSLQEWFGRLVGVRGRAWIGGPFGEFVIEPTLEAICVPKPHPSGGVALSLFATHRPQSLFGEVTKHQAHIFRNRACGVSLRRQSNCTANASALVSESAIISVIWQIQGLKSSRGTSVSQSRKHCPYPNSLCSTTGGAPGKFAFPFHLTRRHVGQ